MNEHPKIIASERFICSQLFKNSNIVANGGVQEVNCFG